MVLVFGMKIESEIWLLKKFFTEEEFHIIAGKTFEDLHKLWDSSTNTSKYEIYKTQKYAHLKYIK